MGAQFNNMDKIKFNKNSTDSKLRAILLILI